MPLIPVSLPEDIRAVVVPYEEVLAHTAHDISTARWQNAIKAAGLPTPTGCLAKTGPIDLSRGDILRFADEEEITAENAMQLLYLSLAWGLGSKGFRMNLKMSGIGESKDHAGETLAGAWRAVREGKSPQECYEVLLTPKGKPRIKQLGAAFATKYLYFCGGLEFSRTPILDAVVARALTPITWDHAPTYAWWSSAYATYAALLTDWAAEATPADEQPVSPDQVELALFRLGQNQKADSTRPSS